MGIASDVEGQPFELDMDIEHTSAQVIIVQRDVDHSVIDCDQDAFNESWQQTEVAAPKKQLHETRMSLEREQEKSRRLEQQLHALQYKAHARRKDLPAIVRRSSSVKRTKRNRHRLRTGYLLDDLASSE